MTQQKKAYVLGLVTVGLWSTVASACKISLRYMSAAELVFYATLTSCIVLLAVVGVQKKISQLGRMGRDDWVLSLKLGILNPFLYYLVLFKAYELLPAQQAQPLNYTWAITLTLLSVPLLGQRITKKQLLAILISYIGVIVIATEGNILALRFENPIGVFLALLSTVFWALYWIANTKDTREPVVGLLMNFLCALPLVTIYVIFQGGLRSIDLPGIVGAAYLGCFEMGIAYILWLTAMKLSANVARLVNLIFLSPFLSLILIYFLVGERILPSTFIGLIFIILGLGLQSRAK